MRLDVVIKQTISLVSGEIAMDREPSEPLLYAETSSLRAPPRVTLIFPEPISLRIHPGVHYADIAGSVSL